jgi:hypothetical protein
MSSGKGDFPRPLAVDRKKYAENFTRTFKKRAKRKAKGKR